MVFYSVLLVVAVLAAQDGCWAQSVTWTNIEGGLKQISVGPAGVWGVNSADNVGDIFFLSRFFLWSAWTQVRFPRVAVVFIHRVNF